jgi:acyl carrier protein
LRAFLRDRLPDYMIPSAFVLLPHLPLNANGKVDRRALPAPDHSQSCAESEYVAPATPVEEVVAAICGEVLGLDRVGTRDSFFELGGNSLSATQFISRLREAFQIEIPLRAIFETPELGRFCELLLSEPENRERIQATAEVLLAIAEMPESQADDRWASGEDLRDHQQLHQVENAA